MIVANGDYFFVASKVEPELEDRWPARRAIYYGNFRGVSPQAEPAAEFHFDCNILAYCIPTRKGLRLLANFFAIDEIKVFRQDLAGN